MALNTKHWPVPVSDLQRLEGGHGQGWTPPSTLGSTSFLVTCRLQEKIISILIRAVKSASNQEMWGVS